MNIRFLGLLGAILPGLAMGGAISIGTSASPLTFNPPSVTLGTCVSNVCTITGTGTLQGAPLQWNIVTTLNGGTSITESGPGLTYPLNQQGAAINFSLTDTPGTDSLGGTVALTSAIDSFFPDVTDITATITYNSVHFVTPALITYFQANYGAIPTIGSTARLDLTVSCGSTTECIPFAGDPTGTIIGATISPSASSTTPEPGSIALCGAGLAGLIYRLRRK